MVESVVVKRDETIYKSMLKAMELEDLEEEKKIEDLKDDARWSIIEHYVADDVDEGDKPTIEAFVCRAIVSLAAEISEKGMRRHRKSVEYYNVPVFNENFDLEQTIENMSGKNNVEYMDIALVNKIPRKLAVTLMFDASNSMEGEKIVMAALAVAALAYKLEKDCYSIVAFKQKADVLKTMDEKMTIEDVVAKILHYEYGDLTNVEDGLKIGLEQLDHCASQEDLSDKIGIIVTDGWVTCGGDPLEEAGKFSKLHVLQIGMGGYREESIECCVAMARIGRGTHVFIEDINELPYAIMNVLRLN
ncbi:MAG: VWA domain-containing protein [Candidatus Methanomethylicus sp.]|nr:VWA domain-containing protein [Candidatus Methanomethylicus sp.]